MSCCGGNRRTHIVSMTAPAAPHVEATRIGATRAVFRYDGARELTVFGTVTGRRYWFSSPGAEVLVDLRDRPSMRRVPNVIEVRLA